MISLDFSLLAYSNIKSILYETGGFLMMLVFMFCTCFSLSTSYSVIRFLNVGLVATLYIKTLDNTIKTVGWLCY